MFKHNVAVVGCGYWGPNLLRNLAENEGADLRWICDIDAKQVAAMGRRYPAAQLTSDCKALFADSSLDAVVIATPVWTHFSFAKQALEAGKHVLCEKPLCRTMEEAKAMIQAAKDAKRTLKCGFNHRHHPAIKEAKRLLDGGDLGRPLFARCRYGICGRPDYQDEWRADPAQAAGGQLLEQGTHALDLFRWFLGEPAEVVCMTSRQYFTAQPLDDNGMVTISAGDEFLQPRPKKASEVVQERFRTRLYIVALTAIVFAVLQLMLKRTRTGLEIRAVSQNRGMARAMGIRSEWVDAATFGLGSGIAGVAGVALSQLTNVGPNLGQSYIVDSFMVVVFGGVGNLWGTLLGGMSLGVINKILEPFAGAVLGKIIVLVCLILFIQRRPRGIFPQKGRAAEA